jgi:hypothetical protein
MFIRTQIFVMIMIFTDFFPCGKSWNAEAPYSLIAIRYNSNMIFTVFSWRKMIVHGFTQ